MAQKNPASDNSLIQQRSLKGGYLLVIGCLFLSSSSALIREALQSTCIPCALCLQFVIAFLCGAPWILLTARKHIDRTNLHLHLARAVVAIFAFLGFYFAVARVPLVNAVLLNNTAPLFIPLLSFVFQRHKMAPTTFFLVLLGFLGVLLILRPRADNFDAASLVGLISGVGAAGSMLLTRRIAITDTSRKALFYYLLFIALLTSPVAIIFWESPSFTGWIALLGAGFFQMLGQGFVIHAFSHASPTHIAPLSYMTVVFSGLIGMAFLGQAPSALGIVGIAIVIAAGSFVMCRRVGMSEGKSEKH